MVFLIEVLCIILLPSLTVSLSSDENYDYPAEPADHGRSYTNTYENGRLYTREIRLKQGHLKGVIVEPRKQPELRSVERFLGLPYAAAPVGSLRFMPPGTAPPWSGLRLADRMAPVCPQNLPETRNFSTGRNNQLLRLMPFLKNQSEDCLYLNIYAPTQDHNNGYASRKHPVIVFIHGESYQWNTGNAYDGSVLASYGRVVVVTINFRLGILGFMKPGIGENTVSNFALMDQIAALQWVKDNIEAFGGDHTSVTLMGHSTGAACANLLMVSPVSRGLFHRAILMSGSALADWAITTNPLQLTMQVAQSLNCPLGDANDEMADCLRRKRLSEIMATQAKTKGPEYSTPFGPVVDGQVVPNDPNQVMGVYTDLFSRYEMLYGLTELESYHLLNGVALKYGMIESDKDSMLRFYIQSKFEYRPDLALATAIREYSDMRDDTTHSLADKHRDVLLDILSDARVAAPLVQTANYHSTSNPNSYLYVFAHNSHAGEYANLDKSVHGEDLAYVFGAPLDKLGGHFPTDYVPKETLFSEAVMTYFRNFAETGNPNAPRRNKFLNLNPSDWKKYDVDWPEYDKINQSYLFLGIPPHVGRKYRYKYMNFWNTILPEILNNKTYYNPYSHTPTKPQFFPTYKTMDTGIPLWDSKPRYPTPMRGGTEPIIIGKLNTYAGHRLTTTEDPYEMIRSIQQPNRILSPGLMDGPGLKGVLLSKPPMFSTNSPETKEEVQESGITTNAVIIIGVAILLINVIAIGGFYYKKNGLRNKDRRLKRTLDKNNEGTDTEENIYNKRIKLDDVEANVQGCNMMNILKQSTAKTVDSYEPVKTVKSSDIGSRFKLTRHNSTSTIDAHTKVRDWIHQEIVQRCSPKILRRPRVENKALKDPAQIKPNAKMGTLTGSLKAPVDLLSDKSSKTQSTRPISPNTDRSDKSIPTNMETISVKSKSLLKKPKKVSVAIDATPSARSNSVLKQQPIELSKSLDYYCTDEPQLSIRRSQTMDEVMINDLINLRRGSTSLSLKLAPDLNESCRQPIDATVVKIEHYHSKSDPVNDLSYINHENSSSMQSFSMRDVNVTSRDESCDDAEVSSEDALTAVKRRNYPKVLPDLPSDYMQYPVTLSEAQIIAQKRRSLPPQSHLLLMPALHEGNAKNERIYSRIPPAPPPRISSTLGRRPSNPSQRSKLISPLMLAKERPMPIEPTITSNTLHVGPLIPTREVKSGLKNPCESSFGVHADHIYGNVGSKNDPIYESLKQNKNQAKTIISANCNQPIKRIEPKVIIKPSINRKMSEPKVNKNIPRVTAQNDNTEPQNADHTTPVHTTDKSQNVSKKSSIPTVKSKIPAVTRSNEDRDPSTSDSSNDTSASSSSTGTIKKAKK